MDSDLIELSRCRDAESVNETTDLLKAADIPFRVGTTAANFDITTIGSGSDPDIIISVRKGDYAAARVALEEEFLKTDLPGDHYLMASSDDEVAEILGKPSEWSPFVVAHARRLSKDRGINLALIEEKRAGRILRLEQGKPASSTLLFLGWAFSILGGLIGLGIAWSLCTMKEKTPEGEYFTYDERSRKTGKSMLVLASVMTAIAVVLRFSNLLSY